MPDVTANGLTIEGCRTRQQRLREQLREQKLDGALFCDPRYVHYFTGFWCRPVFSRAVLLERDGPLTLVAPFPPTADVAADRVVPFESNRLGTLVDDPFEQAFAVVKTDLSRLSKLGCDAATPSHFLPSAPSADLEPLLRSLRRCKDADELILIRRAVAAAEAAYEYARDNLRAGLSEMELYAGMQEAAVVSAGEPIGEFGNDFQIGAVGSTPRLRAAQTGEVAILDVSVSIRGYHSDLCRSYVVGATPSDAQLAAHGRIIESLRNIESLLRPGVSCRGLYEAAREMLDGFQGWSFPHHLGHGIGLSPHESPRLNPHWDDTLQVGDVWTVEPGLYSPDLRAGLRIEENYWLSGTGPVKLSRIPTAL
jgi:Xaa-Pro dipeptidase